MFQLNPRRALMIGMVAALTATAAPAHAQLPVPGASVSSGEKMRYLGGNANNDVRITITGTSFTIDDVVPIKIGTGCQAVAGDATKAKCLAPKAGSKFLEFEVLTGSGNDTVVNGTSNGTVAGASMRANGGAGNDVLIGDLKVKDVLLGSNDNDDLRDSGGSNELDGAGGDDKLRGGAGGDILDGGVGNDLLDGGGSDDQLDGGAGRDIIDGGPAGISPGERHDRVIYSERTGSITVNLNRSDATQGAPGENDTILDVEDISSGSGGDSLIGNQFANTIDGGAGNDGINGGLGRDVLAGGDGADFLTPSLAPNVVIPIGALPDGEPDIIECGKVGRSDGDPGDQAFRVVSDGDVTNDCATVVDQ